MSSHAECELIFLLNIYKIRLKIDEITPLSHFYYFLGILLVKKVEMLRIVLVVGLIPLTANIVNQVVKTLKEK